MFIFVEMNTPEFLRDGPQNQPRPEEVSQEESQSLLRGKFLKKKYLLENSNSLVSSTMDICLMNEFR